MIKRERIRTHSTRMGFAFEFDLKTGRDSRDLESF